MQQVIALDKTTANNVVAVTRYTGMSTTMLLFGQKKTKNTPWCFVPKSNRSTYTFLGQLFAQRSQLTRQQIYHKQQHDAVKTSNSPDEAQHWCRLLWMRTIPNTVSTVTVPWTERETERIGPICPHGSWFHGMRTVVFVCYVYRSTLDLCCCKSPKCYTWDVNMLNKICIFLCK